MNAPATITTTPKFDALDLADLLLSGSTGNALAADLEEHFAEIKRADVWTAVRIAAAVWNAAIIEAQAERDAVKLDLDAALIRCAWLTRQVECMRDSGAWLRTSTPAQALHG